MSQRRDLVADCLDMPVGLVDNRPPTADAPTSRPDAARIVRGPDP
jgi:hypothetical protein